MTERKTDITAEVLVLENPRAHELIEAAEVLLDRAGRFNVIQSDADAGLAAEFRARVNQQIKDLDAERLDMGEGLRQTLEKINAKFRGPIEGLKAKLALVDGALKAYLEQKRQLALAAERAQREQEEARQREIRRLELARQEEEARLQREHEAAVAAAAAANAPPPPPVEVLPPVELPPPLPVVAPIEVPKGIAGSYGSKVGSRDNWKYRIVDIKKVPEEFLVPPEERVNKAALNAMARSMKDKAKVKGIEFYSEASLTSRVS